MREQEYFQKKVYNRRSEVAKAFAEKIGAVPKVVNPFCKGYDWSGKTVHAFATSGGSGIGKTAEKLAPFVNGAVSVDAKLIHSADDIE